MLDVATGTADFAIAAASHTDAKIIGIDIAEKMLAIAERKINKRKLNHRIDLKLADSENLPFKNEKFDTVTASFGIRNF